MSTTTSDDKPFGVFRLGYSVFVWAMVIVMGLILGWILWKMFALTPAGTRQTQLINEIRPTQDAVASEVAARLDPCFVPPPKVDVCLGCHTIGGKSGAVQCPSLAEIGKTAAERIKDPAYTGTAKTAEEYIRESIQKPSIFVVTSPAGKSYGSPGTSVMPPNLEKQIKLDEVVAYLVALNPDTQTCGKGTPTAAK